MQLLLVAWEESVIWLLIIELLILPQQLGLKAKLIEREFVRWLQGFPDTYVIPVADASAYKQFGNSVAVPAIQATAKQILNELNIGK